MWLLLLAALGGFGEREGMTTLLQEEPRRQASSCRPTLALLRSLPALNASERCAPVPAAPPSTARICFVLAAHVATRHQANILMLSLFSIQQHHPSARVIAVDNASPHPLSLRFIAERDAWWASRVKVLRVNRSNYEFGAFDTGLRFAAGEPDASLWALGRFDQFCFMQ